MEEPNLALGQQHTRETKQARIEPLDKTAIADNTFITSPQLVEVLWASQWTIAATLLNTNVPNEAILRHIVPESLLTPLHIAALRSAPMTVVSSLIHNMQQIGLGLDGRDRDGATALHMAAFRDEWDLVKILCENGARVDVVDESGETPLHVAASRGVSESVVSLLVSHCPRARSIISKRAQTPVDVARVMRKHNLVPILVLPPSPITLALDGSSSSSSNAPASGVSTSNAKRARNI